MRSAALSDTMRSAPHAARVPVTFSRCAYFAIALALSVRECSTSWSTDLTNRGEVDLGVTTHGEVHVAAPAPRLGKLMGTESSPATAAGC